MFTRMDHGERGMGVSHLRYEDEEGECVVHNIDVFLTGPLLTQTGSQVFTLTWRQLLHHSTLLFLIGLFVSNLL